MTDTEQTSATKARGSKKHKAMKTVLIIESVILALLILYGCLRFLWSRETQLLKEYSPNGDYFCTITELGTPGPLYDRVRVSLIKYKDIYSATFEAKVSNMGYTAYYELEWMDDGLLITLDGSNQPEAYYFLPFEPD